MDFTGTWAVESSPDFDADYMKMVGEPYVRLRQEGDSLSGDYSIGLRNDDIDGRVEAGGRALFSFEGMDEMDEVNGTGTIAPHGDDRLTFTLMYHMGDDFSFECRRQGTA